MAEDSNDSRGPRPDPVPPARIYTLESGDARVRNLWQDYPQEPASWGNSLLIHLLVLAALIIPYTVKRVARPPDGGPRGKSTIIYMPLVNVPGPDQATHGGGASGDRSLLPASKGKLPPFASEQLTPALAKILATNPLLPAQPTLVGPPEMKLAGMGLDLSWGDPNGVAGPTSGGPGTGGSFGSADGTGIGSGKGPGYGPGENGGCCEGVYSVGGNVSAPVAVFNPEPPYTEQARKAKFQGKVVLAIIVDAQGHVADVRVVKPLGMGLDESAVEAVRTWKFLPGRSNDAPVAVRVLVEVTFHLF